MLTPCSPPRRAARRPGHDAPRRLLFFEDVTEIVKVQRMEAWREVARRIAHEIKNPLTPIQLSAQRLHKRYAEQLKDDGRSSRSARARS